VVPDGTTQGHLSAYDFPVVFVMGVSHTIRAGGAHSAKHPCYGIRAVPAKSLGPSADPLEDPLLVLGADALPLRRLLPVGAGAGRDRQDLVRIVVHDVV